MKELLFKLSRWERKAAPFFIIWGAGYRGKQLFSYISQISDKIYFCDSNKEKYGKEIVEGCSCISKEEAKKISEESIVLISPEKSDDLYKELSEIFPYICPNIILEILNYYPKANGYNYHMPIGHYCSLYPKMSELETKLDSLYDINKEIKDINFNIEEQMNTLNKMKELFSTMREWYDSVCCGKYRYKEGSTSFGISDAACLNLMLRILKPKRIIEVGSGWSSAVALDTNEFYCNNQMEISFIEPYPDTLLDIMKKTDRCDIKICGLQDVDVSFFEQLDEGDILFIDSTHVSKMGSDVNYLFFEIIPRLKRGVYIHFHDIFYPFEYPLQWIKESGQIWNELYLLRAFLLNNENYKIIFWYDYLRKMHSQKIEECINMPGAAGGSFWMKKV